MERFVWRIGTWENNNHDEKNENDDHHHHDRSYNQMEKKIVGNFYFYSFLFFLDSDCKFFLFLFIFYSKFQDSDSFVRLNFNMIFDR